MYIYKEKHVCKWTVLSVLSEATPDSQSVTDYASCFVCGTFREEPELCPAQSTRHTVHDVVPAAC